MLRNTLADLRYGLRLLLRFPLFTAVAVCALALGIGANTAIFSTVDAVVLRALPYADADRLVMLWEEAAFAGYPRATPAPGNYSDWKRQNRLFEGMAAMQYVSASLTLDGPPEQVAGQAVTPDFFTVLGVQPALGASAANVTGMVIRHGLGLTGSGLALGCAAAWLATRAIGKLLYGVRVSDPATFAAVTALLAGIAALACWIPARRASQVDPLTVLRDG